MFGSLLEQGFAEKKPLWPEWMHGFLSRRRSEDSELLHGAAAERLRAAGVTHINGSGCSHCLSFYFFFLAVSQHNSHCE